MSIFSAFNTKMGIKEIPKAYMQDKNKNKQKYSKIIFYFKPKTILMYNFIFQIVLWNNLSQLNWTVGMGVATLYKPIKINKIIITNSFEATSEEEETNLTFLVSLNYLVISKANFSCVD